MDLYDASEILTVSQAFNITFTQVVVGSYLRFKLFFPFSFVLNSSTGPAFTASDSGRSSSDDVLRPIIFLFR